MSKHQLKRIKKYEDLMKKRPERRPALIYIVLFKWSWLFSFFPCRAKERQKKKERLQSLKEQGVELGPSRKRLKKNSMADSLCKTQVAVDCSFDHLMSDKVRAVGLNNNCLW
jgi:tRNA (guanine9-N1)-methyltransferase